MLRRGDIVPTPRHTQRTPLHVLMSALRTGNAFTATGRRIDPLHRKVFTGPVRRNTPLINAVRQGRADIVAALIADGHDVNELCGPGRRHGRGVTALYVACRTGHRYWPSVVAEVVTVLLAANAETHQADSEGVTPLLIACEMGHTEIVTKLLAANANVNQADEEGRAPLWVACHGATPRSSRS